MEESKEVEKNYKRYETGLWVFLYCNLKEIYTFCGRVKNNHFKTETSN
jgi:hypothetical protein